MRYFTCVVRQDGAAAQPLVGEGERCSTFTDGPFAAAAGGNDAGISGEIVHDRPWIGVGDVRLDDREALRRTVGRKGDGMSDLALVLTSVRRSGPEVVRHLLGDFAFVLWNARDRSVIAARDAFGQRGLFVRQSPGSLTFTSRASLLEDGRGYDPGFIASHLVAASEPDERSPFADVRTIPSGAMLIVDGDAPRIRSFWEAAEIAEQPVRDVDSVAEHFRELLAAAVIARGDSAGCWSQLSGGLDSSSVVCMHAHLAATGVVRNPLLGTMTMVDTLGDGDERRFVRAVVERTGVRNEMVLDDWLWRDDGHEPPRTEAPTANYPFFARDRACCELIRAGGGRVLLTGQGGDQYLSSLPYYIADDLARWRLRDACDAALEWAVANRRSFWTTLARHGLRPLLPARARLAIAERHLRIPGWVRNDFARTECIAERVPLRLMLDARRGELYRGAVAYETAHYGRYTDLTLYQQLFDLRHPFLYRPLVELGLSLPPRLRTRPRQQKWILREAMRGILPDEVRRRSGKGGIDSRIVWSLARELPRLRELLREPILAELGCIEPRPLREELERASRGDVTRVVPLMCALSLETWLQVRAGLWTVRASASSDDALRSAV